LPGWLVPIIREHLDRYPVSAEAPVFANAVGKPLRRTLFRSRIWRPALVRAGLLGTLTVIDENTVRTGWTDDTGATLAKEFTTERDAIIHIAKSCTGGLRFHDLRHSYATWLVDDGVPVNMVQRVMGHERSSTTLDLYTGALRITTGSCKHSMTMTSADDSLTIDRDHSFEDRLESVGKASELRF
jgi:integrase